MSGFSLLSLSLFVRACLTVLRAHTHTTTRTVRGSTLALIIAPSVWVEFVSAFSLLFLLKLEVFFAAVVVVFPAVDSNSRRLGRRARSDRAVQYISVLEDKTHGKECFFNIYDCDLTFLRYEKLGSWSNVTPANSHIWDYGHKTWSYLGIPWKKSMTAVNFSVSPQAGNTAFRPCRALSILLIARRTASKKVSSCALSKGDLGVGIWHKICVMCAADREPQSYGLLDLVDWLCRWWNRTLPYSADVAVLPLFSVFCSAFLCVVTSVMSRGLSVPICVRFCLCHLLRWIMHSTQFVWVRLGLFLFTNYPYGMTELFMYSPFRLLVANYSECVTGSWRSWIFDRLSWRSTLNRCRSSLPIMVLFHDFMTDSRNMF